MADNTGAPWLLPYPEDTDLVRDGASDIEALAVATAAGLSAAIGLVAVKSAIFTGTQSASVTAGNNLSVTNLTITHALADASNRLIISGYLGGAASSNQIGQVGVAVHDGTGLISVGNAEGTRTRVTAGGRTATNTNTQMFTMPSFTIVHAPGDTTSRTYTLRAINTTNGTVTLFINRYEADSDGESRARATAGLVIQEVKV